MDGSNIRVPHAGAAKLDAHGLRNVVNPLLKVVAKQNLPCHPERRTEPVADFRRRLSRADS
jgi:hypothetical protein